MVEELERPQQPVLDEKVGCGKALGAEAVRGVGVQKSAHVVQELGGKGVALVIVGACARGE